MTAPRSAATIDDVLALLREVVDESTVSADRVGYFAALYRQITVAVARAIDDGVFEDGERMSRLDARFANRYFAALHAWRMRGEPSRCWRTAFRAADEDGPVLVQHLVLGVNAHINLDLAIAAARMCPGDSIRRPDGRGAARPVRDGCGAGYAGTALPAVVCSRPAAGHRAHRRGGDDSPAGPPPGDLTDPGYRSVARERAGRRG
jgi:Family of unknown function (DUF5995)